MKKYSLSVSLLFIFNLLLVACSTQVVAPTTSQVSVLPQTDATQVVDQTFYPSAGTPALPAAAHLESLTELGQSPVYPAPSEASTVGFIVTDALGRQVAFKHAPQRIVVAGRGVFMLADALFFFPEASDRLVAIGKTAQWKSDFAPFVDPHFTEKTILETEAGPEQIAAMQPDLVILKSFMAEKLGAPLESIGIPVIYVDFEKPEQYPGDIDILGQVFQDGLRARQVGTFYENQLDRVKQALAGLREDQKPGILTLYYSEKDGQVAFNVPPVPFIQTWMAMIAGAKPLWQDIELGNGWTKVNFEQIAAWDAEQIFIVAYTSDATRVVAELKNNPNWQGLRAVKNGKLFAFPADFYSWTSLIHVGPWDSSGWRILCTLGNSQVWI